MSFCSESDSLRSSDVITGNQHSLEGGQTPPLDSESPSLDRLQCSVLIKNQTASTSKRANGKEEAITK